jgi:hypothetical protein
MELERKPTNQELIIRQSCLRTAAEISTKNNIDVLELAEVFEKWVNRKIKQGGKNE